MEKSDVAVGLLETINFLDDKVLIKALTVKERIEIYKKLGVSATNKDGIDSWLKTKSQVNIKDFYKS